MRYPTVNLCKLRIFVYVQAEEHDIPVWTRDVSDVRRPDVRVSHMPEDGRAENSSLLGSHAQLRSLQ
jgi:hypothetical protein